MRSEYDQLESWLQDGGGLILTGLDALSNIQCYYDALNPAGDDDDDDLFDEEDYEVPDSADDVDSYSEPAASETDHGVDDDPNYRVDEDGTEWWQDDAGVWWYRDPDMEDWAEWTE